MRHMQPLQIQSMRNDVRKLAIFSDIHFGKNKNNTVKLENACSYIDWMIGRCYDANADAVAFLGDWFDNRDTLGVTVINRSYECLKILTRNFPVLMLLGNHDVNLKNSNSINSLKPFKEIEKLTIVENDPVVWTVSGKSILVCPWNTDVKAIEGKYDYMLGHFEYNGATLTSKVEEGRAFNMSDLVEKAPVVFTGHYHIVDRHRLKEGTLFSVGSPFEQDWGDAGNTKFIHTLDIASGVVDNIPNDFSPRHIQYLWSLMKTGVNSVSEAMVKHNYISLVVDEKFNFEEIGRAYNEILKLNPIKCDVEYRYNFMKDFVVDAGKRSSLSTMTKLQYIEKCVDDIPADKCDASEKSGIVELANRYYGVFAAEDMASGISGVIKFRRMTIKNFLSFGHETAFDFDKHSGLNYIFGVNRDMFMENNDSTGLEVRNGTGKSAFMDALLFVLFGDTAKKIDLKYIPNRRATEPTAVTLSFDIGVDKYYIETGIPKSKKSSTFKLFKNDEDISKGTVPKTREYFEKEVIGTNIDLFKNTITLTTCNSVNFFSLGKQGRKSVTESIFRLGIFGKMLKNVRADMNNMDRDLNIFQTQYEQINGNIAKYELNGINFNKQKEAAITSLKGKIEQQMVFRRTISQEIEDLQKQLVDVELVDQSEKFQKLSEAKTKLEAAVSNSNRHIRHLDEVKGKYNVVLTEICKDCYDKVSGKLDIAETEKNMEKMKSDIVKYNGLLEKIRGELVSITNAQKEYQRKLNMRETNERAVISRRSQVEKFEGIVRQIQEQIASEEAKVSPFEQMMADENVKVGEVKRKMEECRMNKKRLDILAFVLDEDGAKKYIIRDMVEVLNERIYVYLKRMGSSFACTFDDGFNCVFLTESGECSYENFSSGEKARINIAVVFAFRDILSGLGTTGSSILGLDEFIDSALDAFAINAVIRIAKECVEQHRQTVFLISHRECLNREDFDNVIEMEKKGGITSIIDDPQGGTNKEE
jgi:hypothetical protein